MQNNPDPLESDSEENGNYENDVCLGCDDGSRRTAVDLWIETNTEKYYWFCSVCCTIRYLFNNFCTGRTRFTRSSPSTSNARRRRDSSHNYLNSQDNRINEGANSTGSYSNEDSDVIEESNCVVTGTNQQSR